jgi:hypothetical protein
MNYKKIYDSIIAKARSANRVKGKETYYEAHHIIPKCLGGDGNRGDWKWHENIILLTAREHFVCHQLLCEIYPENKKLIYALNMMCTIDPTENKSRYLPSSKIVEYYKLKFVDIISKRERSIEEKDKLRNSHRGKKFTEDHKQKLKKSKTGDKNPMYNKTHSDETKNKMSKSGKLRSHSEETKLKISNLMKGKKRKPFSEETKLKMKESALNREQNKNLKLSTNNTYL